MLADIPHELAVQISGRGKDAANNDIAFNFGKPEFDLVEPGRIGGSVVNMDAGMIDQKLFHALCLVSREVVDNDVNLALARLMSEEMGKKGDEFFTGMSGCRLADDLTRPCVQRCI